MLEKKGKTIPSKQCKFCNYLYDKSLISHGCPSGSSGQSVPGGPGGPGGPSGPSGPSAWLALMICIQKIYGLHGLNHQLIEKNWDDSQTVDKQKVENRKVDQEPQYIDLYPLNG